MNSDQPLPPPLKVMIVYEDLAAGRRAKEFVDRLWLRLGPDVNMELHVCRFDLLHLSPFREEALENGFRADILILSSRQGVQVPDDVQQWLEVCRNANVCPSTALVMLLNENGTIADEPRLRSAADGREPGPVRLSVMYEALPPGGVIQTRDGRRISLAAVGALGN
jgi:hypothetical protein